jgi:hypothetical protein
MTATLLTAGSTKALGRSAGAVGNCLTRLATAGQVRQVSTKPRRYSSATPSTRQTSPDPAVAGGEVMKVIGLGSPDDVQCRFDACEIDVLVEVLRDLRAKATRDAADTYTRITPPDLTTDASQPTNRAGHRRLHAEPRRDWARR